ncbi:MAG: hypothetical protein IID40_00720 [Planctomycetes bacterium]|nr:hypothetical protein [Planctomycetota bacterium]
MWQTIGQYVGGRVLTAILVVGSAAGVIWFWKHPEQLQTLWLVIKYVLVWLGFVLVLPWALFFVPPWVLKKESNLATGLMLGGYVLADVVFAFILAGGVGGHGTLTWGVLLLGFLAAGVYNFLVCDHQAEMFDEAI